MLFFHACFLFYVCYKSLKFDFFLKNISSLPHLWCDNKAMVNFINGEGAAKGVRHMELRMWYVRERYKQGNVVIGTRNSY